MRLLIVLVAMFFAANGLEAQRNCKKGIPCGGSCISPSKTCRIGTSPAPAPARASTSDTLLSDGTPIPRLLGARRTSDAAPPPPVGLYDWIANVDGVVYYSRFCEVAKERVLPDEAVYFRNEEDAQRAGYKRSKAKGC